MLTKLSSYARGRAQAGLPSLCLATKPNPPSGCWAGPSDLQQHIRHVLHKMLRQLPSPTRPCSAPPPLVPPAPNPFLPPFHPPLTAGLALLTHSSTSAMSSTKCSGSPANSGGGGVGSGSWIADRLPLQEGHAVTIIQEAISLQTGARGVPGEEGGRTTVGNYKGSGSPANSGRRGRWQRQLDGRQAAIAGGAGSDDHPRSHQPAEGQKG